MVLEILTLPLVGFGNLNTSLTRFHKGIQKVFAKLSGEIIMTVMIGKSFEDLKVFFGNG